jgi:hypothetical protein
MKSEIVKNKKKLSLFGDLQEQAFQIWRTWSKTLTFFGRFSSKLKNSFFGKILYLKKHCMAPLNTIGKITKKEV